MLPALCGNVGRSELSTPPGEDAAAAQGLGPGEAAVCRNGGLLSYVEAQRA